MEATIEEAGAAYGSYVGHLAGIAGATDPERVLALDGQAASELRRLVPLSTRRRLGAFFTPHVLADELAEPLQDETRSLNVVDSFCGAGDLLLAAMRAAHRSRTRGRDALAFSGVDLVAEFARAALLRLELQAAELGIRPSIRTRAGDGLAAAELVRATHVLLNPPFGRITAPDPCTWASGSVNGAAVYFASTVAELADETKVHAVLPDVLRSGSRYRKWRTEIDQLLDVSTVTPLGQFDRWTDVNVFILRGTRTVHRRDMAGSR